MGTGYKRCDKCNGTGQWVAPISRYGAPSRCPDCGGQGSVRIPDDECQEIGGPHNFQLVDKDNDEGPIRCVDCGETRGDDMPTDKPRGKVERAFEFNKTSYRLVTVGKHSAGYQDSFMLQERETDEVGGDRWTTIVSADASDNDNQLLLLKIIAGAKLP